MAANKNCPAGTELDMTFAMVKMARLGKASHMNVARSNQCSHSIMHQICVVTGGNSDILCLG